MITSGNSKNSWTNITMFKTICHMTCMAKRSMSCTISLCTTILPMDRACASLNQSMTWQLWLPSLAEKDSIALRMIWYKFLGLTLKSAAKRQSSESLRKFLRWWKRRIWKQMKHGSKWLTSWDSKFSARLHKTSKMCLKSVCVRQVPSRFWD